MTRGVHRRRTRLAATTACAWLLSPPVSEAGPQTAPPAQGVAPAVEAERVPNPSVLDETTLVASASASPASLEVGAPVVYELRFEGPAAGGVTVALDAFRVEAAAGDPTAFDLLESTPLARAGDAWTMRLVLSTFDTGDATPPALACAWREDGRIRRMLLPLPTVEVASLAGPDATPADFRDIAGPIAPEQDDRGWWIAPIGAVAATTLAVAAVALWLRRDRRGPTPAERARDELARLAAQGLPSRGESQAFYDALVRVVRTFVVAACEIPADRRTSRELLEAAAGDPRIGPAGVERLRGLLALADRVKFGGASAEALECETHLVEARRFVDSVSAAAAEAPHGARPGSAPRPEARS